MVNRRNLIIGSLIAVMAVLAVAMAVSVAWVFLQAGGSNGRPGWVASLGSPSHPGPPGVQAPMFLRGIFGFTSLERIEVEEKTVPASSPSVLELDSQIGNTVITAADVQEVTVRATKYGRGNSQEAAEAELKNLLVEVTQQAEKVRVVARRNTPTSSGNPSSIDLEVMVPVATASTVRVSLGNLRISGTRGTTTINSSLGNVELSDVQGDLQVRCSLGNMEIRGAKIDQSLRLADRMGNIHFQGELPTTGTGNVDASLGNVSLEIPPGSSVAVDAAAKLGKISSDFPGAVSKSGPASNFKASVGSGGFQLQVQNKMGNVELRSSSWPKERS